MQPFPKSHYKVVQALLENGADVNAQGQSGWTALHSASRSNNYDVVQALLDKRADVNAATADGKTPLMVASSGGHIQVVKSLLAHGVNVNARDKNARTALSEALISQSPHDAHAYHAHVAELLIQAGAQSDPDI